MPQKKATPKRKIHKTRILEDIGEVTGIPHGYAKSVEWFAERIILAILLVGAMCFAAGALFVLHLAEPLGESQAYGVISNKARDAQENVLVYTQQVIDIASPFFTDLLKANRHEPDLEEERIAAVKEKLRAYLSSKNSPFATDEEALEAFATSKNMKMMVAISFVESTFGKRCYYYNCSGIGGTPPNLRKYASYADWIRDFDSLLERRYKDLPPEKFMGLYVQPGSPNWIFGVKQVLREFEEQGIEA
jgi:hypothetical protein